jgi:hypothetical protein
MRRLLDEFEVRSELNRNEAERQEIMRQVAAVLRQNHTWMKIIDFSPSNSRYSTTCSGSLSGSFVFFFLRPK